MKVETLSFQEILGHTPDIFEAVVVASHRALQINSRRVAERVDFEEEYLEEDYQIISPIDEDAYVEEEKSTVLAMDDFLNDRLSWRYFDPESEETSEESE